MKSVVLKNKQAQEDLRRANAERMAQKREEDARIAAEKASVISNPGMTEKLE